MRKNIFTVFIYLIIFSAPTLLKAQMKPNILFILTDDHAYQAIGAYGNKQVTTPSIDRLAREGILLTNNFVTNSICGPSRATLLTGKYSHKNGYALNEKQFDNNQSTLPNLLQQNGYQTAWIGKMHLGTLPKGFDYLNILPGQGTYFNPLFINNQSDTIRYPGYVTNLISDFLFDWMEQRDTSKPFFAVVGEKATHRSWQPDLRDLGAYDSVYFPLPATFYDPYESRPAAKDQDMTIEKTLLLKEDLKIGQFFGETSFEQAKPALIESLKRNYPKRQFNDAELKQYYIKRSSYGNMDSLQSKAYQDYYGNITKEFEQKKLAEKELTEWKFQRYMKDYYATAKSLDRNIGRILHYLDSTGLSKNTVVIYASDQGFYLGEHGWFDKRFMYDESFKTPFVIRYPEIIKPGIKLNHFVSNADWAPTILDLAGAKVPVEIQGRSFLPLLTQKKVTDWRKNVYYHYYEYPQPHRVSPHFGVRSEEYLLIRFYKGVETWELFDLKNDPQQLRNLYGNSKYAAAQKDMKEKLKSLILQYDDQEALVIYNAKLN